MLHAARNNVDATAWKNSPIKVHEHSDLKRYKVVQATSSCFRQNSFTTRRQNGDATDDVPPPGRRSTGVTSDILSLMSSMFDDDNDHEHEGEASSKDTASDDNQELRSSRRVHFESEKVDDYPDEDMQLMFSTPDVSISFDERPIDSVAMTEEHFLMQHSAEGIRKAHYGAEKSRRDASIADFFHVPLPSVQPFSARHRLDKVSTNSSTRSEVSTAMMADELLLEIRSKHPELVEHLEFLVGFEREVAEPLHRRQSQTASPRQHYGEVDSTLAEIDRCLRMSPERLEATVFKQHEELVRLRVFS